MVKKRGNRKRLLDVFNNAIPVNKWILFFIYVYNNSISDIELMFKYVLPKYKQSLKPADLTEPIFFKYWIDLVKNLITIHNNKNILKIPMKLGLSTGREGDEVG